MTHIDFHSILEITIIPIRVDWSAILKDIKDHGLSYNQQALSIGVQYSTLQRWMSGAEPGYSYGHSVLILHSDVCGRESTLKRLKEYDNMR